MSPSWQDLAADKKQRQAACIPKEWVITPPADTVLDVRTIPDECGLLTPKEVEITNTTDVQNILNNLATGKWSSLETTLAFYKRAIIAQQLVNCLTEIFIERALARAKELDEQLKATGKVAGPLHGLPVSLKDQLSMRGLETTMGWVSWIGKFSEHDAVVVQIIYDAGAVPFVRTNIPQTLMWAESYNMVFGRTLNPANRKLTSGGSSGGEGALIGMRGSPLGVGSDIGGSIRIPSGYNGLYGLRPSYHRVPYAGATNSLLGQDSIPSVLGPLSNSMSGIKVFMQAISAYKPWTKDPLARYAPWDASRYALAEHGGGKRLCFAIMWTDGMTTPHPPVTRALEMTKRALVTAGHKVIDWKPYRHKEICDTVYDVWTAASKDDYASVASMSGEPVLNTMEMEAEHGAPNSFLPAQDNVTAHQLWQFHKTKAALRQEYLDYWNSTSTMTGSGRPVDAIICPVSPYGGAPPHGHSRIVDYTAVWNGLDYATCVFPVTRVNATLDAKKPSHQFLNPRDKAHYEMWDLQTFWNAPIGLQLVGRCQEEEAVIAMTEIVDVALKKWNPSKL
ncbi:general amidase [Phanerochaete sordida]|uniref:amidase n=1 Tax=Phanerochaete sordida TaxID=48140 RepID=A0A9P3L9U5_9APHY|nr:general amidase [Phanerochaete sordida]